MKRRRLQVGQEGEVDCPLCDVETFADASRGPQVGVWFSLGCGCRVSGPELEGRAGWQLADLPTREEVSIWCDS
jgi:hypothetical protein